MASPVDVQLILCDAAQADPNTGKVHMLGAGWSTARSPFQHAVVVLIKVPWDRANQPLKFTLDLVTADGEPHVINEPDAKGSIHGEGVMEVGRPPGIAPGSMLDASYALNIPAIPLKPGRYQWRLILAEREIAASFTVLG